MKYIIVHPCNVARCGSIEEAIKQEYCEEWDSEKIKKAFNFGRGTQSDFMRYVKDNHYKIIEQSA